MEENNEKNVETTVEENQNGNVQERVEEKVSEVVTETEKEKASSQDTQENNKHSDVEKEANKGMAILCYLSLLVLIPYFNQTESKWLRAHAIQGMNILILEIIGILCQIIPFIGGIASTIIEIYVVVISIMGIIHVLNGEDKELPLMHLFQFIKK